MQPTSPHRKTAQEHPTHPEPSTPPRAPVPLCHPFSPACPLHPVTPPIARCALSPQNLRLHLPTLPLLNRRLSPLHTPMETTTRPNRTTSQILSHPIARQPKNTRRIPNPPLHRRHQPRSATRVHPLAPCTRSHLPPHAALSPQDHRLTPLRLHLPPLPLLNRHLSPLHTPMETTTRPNRTTSQIPSHPIARQPKNTRRIPNPPLHRRHQPRSATRVHPLAPCTRSHLPPHAALCPHKTTASHPSACTSRLFPSSIAVYLPLHTPMETTTRPNRTTPSQDNPRKPDASRTLHSTTGTSPALPPGFTHLPLAPGHTSHPTLRSVPTRPPPHTPPPAPPDSSPPQSPSISPSTPPWRQPPAPTAPPHRKTTRESRTHPEPSTPPRAPAPRCHPGSPTCPLHPVTPPTPRCALSPQDHRLHLPPLPLLNRRLSHLPSDDVRSDPATLPAHDAITSPSPPHALA
jgi:hypothetical protein